MTLGFVMFLEVNGAPHLLIGEDDRGALIAVTPDRAGDVRLTHAYNLSGNPDGIWRTKAGLYARVSTKFDIVRPDGALDFHFCDRVIFDWVAERYSERLDRDLSAHRDDIERCPQPLPSEVITPCDDETRPDTVASVGLSLTIASSGKVTEAVPMKDHWMKNPLEIPEVTECLVTLVESLTITGHGESKPITVGNLFSPRPAPVVR